MKGWGGGLVGTYFERTRSYSTPRFIVELSLVPFGAKIAIALILHLVGQTPAETTTDVLADEGLAALFFGGLILSPLIETVVGQWLFIWLLSFLTRSTPVLVLGSALLFSALHLHVGIAGALIVFPIGIALSWSFILFRARSRQHAYWVTAAVHSLHNGVAIFLYLLLP